MPTRTATKQPPVMSASPPKSWPLAGGPPPAHETASGCPQDTESRPDQEEGGELDFHQEVRHFRRSRRDQEEGGGAGPPC